jgi:hypothetical protein
MGLLILHVGLLAWGAYVHSPTLNEPGHLVAGISYWKSGHFDVYSVNPPLVRLVAAVPAMLAGAKTDWRSYTAGKGARPECSMGEDFAAANGKRFFWLVTLSRWACIPFSLVGACVCYLWAKELYGARSGLFSLTLWCFCPNVIAHGQLLTCDVAGTALGAAACFLYWRWLRAPSWRATFMSGGALGLAVATKSTLLLLYPLFPAMWLVYRWLEPDSRRRGAWCREMGMLTTIALIGLYIVNLVYNCEGTGTRLREFDFVSTAFASSIEAAGTPEQKSADGVSNRFVGTWLGALPIPLPKNYLIGIDLQRHDFEVLSQPSYLRGRFSPRGWWYYYLYALAVKVPLGAWVIVCLAGILGMRHPLGVAARDEFALLCPAAAVFVLVSTQTGFSAHMRYVLPIFAPIYIWSGRSVRIACNLGTIMNKAVLAGAMTWFITSSLWTYPHSLAYFNELAGGPRGGPFHLIGSNLDWGQDLLKLQAWLNQHPEARPLRLAYFGPIDARCAHIEYSWDTSAPPNVTDHDARPFHPEPGWYAISVNLIRGFPHSVETGHRGQTYTLRVGELAEFQRLRAFASIGYSIYIYHLGEGS